MTNLSSDQEFDSLHSSAPINPHLNVTYQPITRRSNDKPVASKRTVVLSLLLALGGITCCIIGVVFFEKAKRLSLMNEALNSERDSTSAGKLHQNDQCTLSEELKTSGLLRFFKKVEDTYFRLNPHDIIYKYRVTREDILEKFRPYDPKPSTIKALADNSTALLKELRSMRYKKEMLKIREAKTLSKTIHFLENNFGSPYDNGYYTGEWMLGPSRFCYMQKFYMLQFSFNAFVGYAAPKTVQGFEHVITIMKLFRDSINQYRRNIEMGVQVGMVNSLEECKVGYDCIADRYRYLTLTRLPEAILRESYFTLLLREDRLVSLNETALLWLQKYRKTLLQSLKEALVKYLGIPLVDFFNYLTYEHIKHCVPSNVSSGLATRPVSYVYNNGVANLSTPTTKQLPTGEQVSGKRAYERILKFFTTTNVTPDEVHQLGWDVLKSLYPQLVEIAKTTTNQANQKKAIADMKTYLNSSDMYFNAKPFPANESDERAHLHCRTMTLAKIYCPVRYEALQRWFAYSQSALSMFQPKLIKMFHWMVGPKKSTPICPISMATNFVPSAGSPSYTNFGSKCFKPAMYYLPFFLDRMGPKYSEWTVSAHEAMPGHHLQSQGYAENFLDQCRDPLLSALFRSRYSDTAFVEGWGLYAENPLIAEDTDIYKNYPLQKYGMLKWQIWRALRLIVDTGLHYKGMTRQRALQLFSKYAWDESDVAEKEVTRYQGGPGQATAYMIGQRAIIDMRKKASQKLGEKFNLRDFHYYILSRGVGPLSFVADQIDRYIECEKNPAEPGCGNVLADKTKICTSTKVRFKDAYYDETLNQADIYEF